MEIGVSAVLFVVALTSFAIYARAIRRMFVKHGGVDRRMRAVQILGTAFALVHLWCLWGIPISGMDVRQNIGLALYVAGLGSFFAAKKALTGYRLTLAFSQDAPQQLIERGIYGRVRHPFYMAYSLTWLAGAVAAPSILTAASTLLMIMLYLSAARVEEEKFAETELAAAYTAYRLRAGMLWPRL